jgi:hypothetical protein
MSNKTQANNRSSRWKWNEEKGREEVGAEAFLNQLTAKSFQATSTLLLRNISTTRTSAGELGLNPIPTHDTRPSLQVQVTHPHLRRRHRHCHTHLSLYLIVNMSPLSHLALLEAAPACEPGDDKNEQSNDEEDEAVCLDLPPPHGILELC